MTPSPRPTPLTDEKWFQVSEVLPFTLAASDPIGGLGEIVPADFARQLERDRSELMEALEIAVDGWDGIEHLDKYVLIDRFRSLLSRLTKTEGETTANDPR